MNLAGFGSGGYDDDDDDDCVICDSSLFPPENQKQMYLESRIGRSSGRGGGTHSASSDRHDAFVSSDFRSDSSYRLNSHKSAHRSSTACERLPGSLFTSFSLSNSGSIVLTDSIDIEQAIKEAVLDTAAEYPRGVFDPDYSLNVILTRRDRRDSLVMLPLSWRNDTLLKEHQVRTRIHLACAECDQLIHHIIQPFAAVGGREVFICKHDGINW